MEINKSLLEQRKKELLGQLERMKDQANMVQGALQILDHLLQTLDKPVVEVSPEALASARVVSKPGE